MGSFRDKSGSLFGGLSFREQPGDSRHNDRGVSFSLRLHESAALYICSGNCSERIAFFCSETACRFRTIATEVPGMLLSVSHTTRYISLSSFPKTWRLMIFLVDNDVCRGHNKNNPKSLFVERVFSSRHSDYISKYNSMDLPSHP